MAEIRSEVVKVRFTKSQYQAMALRAGAEDRTISEWVRLLVAVKLKGTEAQESTYPEPEQPSSDAPTTIMGPDECDTQSDVSEPVETVGKDEWADLLAGIDSFEEEGG